MSSSQLPAPSILFSAVADNNVGRVRSYFSNFPDLVLTVDTEGNSLLRACPSKEMAALLVSECIRLQQSQLQVAHASSALSSPVKDFRVWRMLNVSGQHAGHLLASSAHGLTPLKQLISSLKECEGFLSLRGDEEISFILNAKDVAGRNILHYASDADTVAFLLEIGAPIQNAHAGDSPLHTFAKAKNVQAGKALLSAVAEQQRVALIHHGNAAGVRAIHVACEKGSNTFFQLLIHCGADIQVKDAKGWTPAHYAAYGEWPMRESHSEILRSLLSAGCDVNASDEMGWTPLHASADIHALTLLIDGGANVNAKDRHGRTAMHLCPPECVHALVAAGASVHVEDWHGETPLHLAGNAEKVRVLLYHRAKLNVVDQNGHTPLDAAKLSNRVDVQTALQAAGATTAAQLKTEQTGRSKAEVSDSDVATTSLMAKLTNGWPAALSILSLPLVHLVPIHNAAFPRIATTAVALCFGAAYASKVWRISRGGVRVHQNICYSPDALCGGATANNDLCLDLYVPTAACDSLLVFIHGGLWLDRDKRQAANIGTRLAGDEHPHVVAVVNYRKSQQGQFSAYKAGVQGIAASSMILHPQHTKDVFAALQFLLHPQTATKFGYMAPNRLTLFGHSCGAHMAALIALAPQKFVQPSRAIHSDGFCECMTCASMRIHGLLLKGGVVCVSGLYDLRAYVKDFPEWAEYIYDSMTDDQSTWFDPVDAVPAGRAGGGLGVGVNSPHDGCPVRFHYSALPPFLILNSMDDAWINSRQADNFFGHLRRIYFDVALNLQRPLPLPQWIQVDQTLRGPHFGLMDDIAHFHDYTRSPFPDQISPRIARFLQQVHKPTNAANTLTRST